MKLNLPTVEDTVQLKYRIPVSLKTELDALAEQCRKQKLDFGTALAEGLRTVMKAIRQELGVKAGLRVEPKVEPKREPEPHVANLTPNGKEAV
jgi:hypothetical protein